MRQQLLVYAICHLFGWSATINSQPDSLGSETEPLDDQQPACPSAVLYMYLLEAEPLELVLCCSVTFRSYAAEYRAISVPVRAGTTSPPPHYTSLCPIELMGTCQKAVFCLPVAILSYG
jgi:hypothetical protein